MTGDDCPVVRHRSEPRSTASEPPLLAAPLPAVTHGLSGDMAGGLAGATPLVWAAARDPAWVSGRSNRP